MTDQPRQYIGFNRIAGKANAWKSKVKMNQATKDRHFLVYIGNGSDLAKEEARQYADGVGLVKPEGYGPEF